MDITINDIRIGIEPITEEVLELVFLLGRTSQTDQEKYETIKPVAEKLNFYCDINSVRCIENCSFLSIKIKKIQFVYYDKESEMFMMQIKNSLNLHILNIKKKVHTIYVYKEPHSSVVSYFSKIRDKIWLLYIKCKLRIQVYIYVYKQLYDNGR